MKMKRVKTQIISQKLIDLNAQIEEEPAAEGTTEIATEDDTVQVNPQLRKVQKLIFDCSTILCGISLFLASYGFYSYSEERNQVIQKAEINARQETVYASRKIEQELRKLQGAANGIAYDLTAGKLKDEQLTNRLREEIERNPDFVAIGAAYQPFVYSRRRLYAPFYGRKDGTIKLNQIEDNNDYAKPAPENEWYFNALRNDFVWAEPYIDKYSEALIVDYNVRFSRTNPKTKKEEPAGVIYANYSIDKLKRLMATLNLGKSGYGFLLSKKGVFIAHPIDEYVKNQKTIFDLATETDKKEIRELGEKALKGESTVVEYQNEITGQSSWMIVEPLPLNGWSLGVVVIKDESSSDNTTLRRKTIVLWLELILFVFFLSILIFRAHRGSVKSLWAVACTYSILCVAAIGIIWNIALSERAYKNSRNILLNKATVDNLLAPQNAIAEELKQDPPLYIPTGVYIQSLKFTGTNDVFVTGYVWQKYNKNIPESVNRGFILPEASDIQIGDPEKFTTNNTDLLRWYFEGTIRQNFNFSKYPFDYNDVWLRLWPKDINRLDLNRTVILVPDLTSYDLINPVSRPGLEEDFVTENWNIESSFFEYKLKKYNSNFGGSGFGKKNYPELYFTVIFKRAFIGIFIARIVPLSVVAILLFSIMLMSNDRGMEVVGACAGFIFIVILDQITVRQQVTATGIIYLEYFYFAIYFFILLVALDAIVLTLNSKIRLIEYKDNLIPKLLYWPGLLTTLLIVTILVFY
ncbi:MULTISPECIES: cache domain-containing protein [Aerosakkonema]|uniref:PDC sensor domain-containing protein n=1 Tax=Aerosakkonema TaxID=1246629 RepID=UPI0035B9E21A